MDTIHFTNTTMYGFKHGYYTIGNYYIKYDLNYPIGEALKMLTLEIGPNNCTECIDNGMINGVFVSCCEDCNKILYRENKTCLCNKSVKKILKNKLHNCDLQGCETALYRKYGNTHKIGAHNYRDFITYNIYGNNKTAMHIRFDEYLFGMNEYEGRSQYWKFTTADKYL